MKTAQVPSWIAGNTRVLTFRGLDAHSVHVGSPAHHLGEREVHVWPFFLDVQTELESQCWGWLSLAEKERASRLRFDHLRRRFIVAHGWLRHILSLYCNQDPHDLLISQAPGGKPRLGPDLLELFDLRFNLTHSNGRAIVALARGFEIGVDLEEVRDAVQHLKLSERFFARTEWEAIKACSDDCQREMFFQYWVGKESVMKAQGTGLLFPLDQCEIMISDKLGEAVISWHGRKNETRKWFARFLCLDPGWVGAVAAEGTDWTITYRG